MHRLNSIQIRQGEFSGEKWEVIGKEFRVGFYTSKREASTELMNVNEALEIADEAVFAFTGEHLRDLQVNLLRSAWEKQTYPEFADAHKYSIDYVKEKGSELWNLLSKATGDTVTKTNFRAALVFSQLLIDG